MSQMTYYQSINNYQIYDQASMQAAAKGKMILLGILMASTFLGVYIFIYRYKSLRTSQSDRHGNSRWADIEEMRKKGLIDGEGVVIGRMCHWWRNYYITHDGSEPIVGIGPTRSGKGLGWVITTLLRWLHSTFVYDPKGENWRLTAWFRKNILKHKCLRFAPNELSGASKYTNARFNPLEEINYGTLEEVSQAQSLATIITDSGELKRDYWERDAATTIQGVILHILYTKPKGNLTDVSFFMSKPPEEFLHEMTNTNHAECLRKKGFPEEQIKIMTDYWGSDINKNIYAVAESLYNMSSKKSQNIPGAQFKPFETQQSKGADGQLQGVLGTAKSFLALYQDPIVAYNISESDFKIDDLYNNDSAVDLYAIAPPSRTQQDRLRPLIRLLISLTLDKIQQSEAKKKHRLLFMIDEFPTLKKMDDIEDAFSTAA
ncbi:MAG: type IV secretory system conjugative DNA transfer family protein, partial [Burkholderiales bacterium]